MTIITIDSNNIEGSENNKSMVDSKGIERGYNATKKRVIGASFGKQSTPKSFLSEKDEFNLVVKCFFGTFKRNNIGKVLLVSKLGDKVLHPNASDGAIVLKDTVKKHIHHLFFP